MSRLVTSFEEIGRAEGQREERRAIVLRQLNRKLGSLPDALQVQITALAPDALLELSEALLDFANQGDLAAWLDEHPSEGM